MTTTMTRPPLPRMAPLFRPHGGLTPALAILKTLLSSYGISVTDEALMTAMQQCPKETRPNQLPITMLIAVAQQMGLDLRLAQRPLDYLHWTTSYNQPFLLVMQPVSDGQPHFVAIWNRTVQFVQLIDPMLGKRWRLNHHLELDLYRSTETIEIEKWKELVTAENFIHALQQRLIKLLGVKIDKVDKIMAEAQDAGWFGLTACDAVIRAVQDAIKNGNIRKGKKAEQLISHWLQAVLTTDDPTKIISSAYWAVLPEPMGEDKLAFQGLLTIEVVGYNENRPTEKTTETTEKTAETTKKAQKKPDEIINIRDYFLKDGRLPIISLIVLTFLSGVGLALQAILLKGLPTLVEQLNTRATQLYIFGSILVFLFLLTIQWWHSSRISYTIGRKFEGRLRLLVLAIFPQLSPIYFQQISPAAMLERVYNLQRLRNLPNLQSSFFLQATQMVLTIVGLLWIDWVAAIITIITLAILICLFQIEQATSSEYMLSFLYDETLSQFYLDAMLGLTAIRTHGAERATRREFDRVLGRWKETELAPAEIRSWLEMFWAFLTPFSVALILFLYLMRGGPSTNLLLLSFWSIQFGSMGLGLIGSFFGYTYVQNMSKQFSSTLKAPLEKSLFPEAIDTPSDTKREPVDPHGVTITMQNIELELAGRLILKNINLHIPARQQIAIVGPSGAGKSTLVSLLLGWYMPNKGEVLIDGSLLTYEKLLNIRKETAWVDPVIQLWNSSFLANLRYGSADETPLNWVIEQADLLSVLERMPNGMQTSLGGEGRLVSGGEGQRVRFGRALQRRSARLVILDEPFRGLDRAKRALLLQHACEFWPRATLICITHDVGQTDQFERVLLIEHNTITEDGDPKKLAADPTTRYAQLLAAEKQVRQELWLSDQWDHLWLEKGKIIPMPVTESMPEQSVGYE